MQEKFQKPDSSPAVIGFPLRRVASPFDTLPAANTPRWVIRRKAEIVAAVRSGAISLEAACDRYKLSIEVFQPADTGSRTRRAVASSP
jgi:hypothetical protein